MVWSCQSTPLHRANAAVRCSFFQPRQAPGRGSWCPGGPGKQRMVSFELTPPAAGITPLFLWMPRRRARRLVWLACSLLQLVTYVCAKCIQGRPGGGSTRISTRKTIIRCSLVQSSIVRIWGQAQGPLAAPLHDVLHSRVPLRAAPLPRRVVLVRDLEWPGATNDEARRKWLGMWLGTWFDAVFVGAGAPRSGAAPPWAFDCAVPPVEDLPPTIEGVHPAR